MKAKDSFARALGGVAGASLGIIVPHLGCLGALTAGAVGAGADATSAQRLAQTGGAAMLVVAAGAGYYSLKSKCALCLIFGETRSIRASKTAAMVVTGFVLAGAFNTMTDRGLANNDSTAHYLEWARDNGQPVWKALNDICFGGPK
mgnify:CR=1 FL=1